MADLSGYDAWKTRTPPCEEDPCLRCRKNQPDHGTDYCDDCLEDERLDALSEVEESDDC